MQTQVRPPRQRSSGGRTLMLLGLVLALAAAGLVLYVTNSVQGAGGIGQTVSVVTARVDLSEGTILTLGTSKAPDMLISAAFQTVSMNKSQVPADAYLYSNQDKLNTFLDNQVVKAPFLQDDILRNNDPRLALLGTTTGTSLTNQNPTVLQTGDVLYTIPEKNTDLGLQPGDTIDIIATVQENGQEVTNTTTLTKILVYAVDKPAPNDIMLVLTNQQLVLLVEYENDGAILTIVIRKPGDPTDPSPSGGNPTTPVTPPKP